MTLRLGLLLLMGSTVIGCQDDAFEPTEHALRTASSSLLGIDNTVERATGFSFFGVLRSRVEDEFVPYEEGRWVFPTASGVITIGFEAETGEPQQFPGEHTDGMEIARIEDLDAGPLLDLPGDYFATATTSSATRGLAGDEHSASAAYAMEYEHDLEGVELNVRAELRTEVTFVGACPMGEISGTVSASGKTPLLRRASRTLQFLARYDGGDLVWQATDDGVVLDEGRLPAAASGC